MREEDSNWFSKWEDELPSPEELTPISQTLITRDLAIAFDIQTPNLHHNNFISPNLSDEPARTLKRPRLVWTPQLHKRFVDAVAHLGIKNAVPKTIMQLMSVDGLTRENVASHLQKYRLYLKRMQGINNGGSGAVSGDTATDQLFASAPIPEHIMGYVSPQIQYHHHHHVNSRQMGQFQVPFLAHGSGHGYVEDDRKVLTLFPASQD